MIGIEDVVTEVMAMVLDFFEGRIGVRKSMT